MSDETRETLEEVLGFLPYRGHEYVHWHDIVNQIDALAEQAIVIPVEVGHDWLLETDTKTTILEVQGCAACGKVNICLVHEHIGTPDPALAIIVPLPKEDKDAIHR